MPTTALGDLPVDGFHLRLGPQVEQTEVEHRLRVVLDLQRVVEVLEPVLPAEVLVDFDNVVNDLRLVRTPPRLSRRSALFDRAKGLDDEHRMMRDDGAAALAHDGRVRHILRVAHIHDVVDDVARIFVERVVRGAVEGRARAVVIDAESAADIEITELVPHLLEFGIEARRLPRRALDRADVRHLRADVEMHQLERVGQARNGVEQIAGRHEFRGRKAKFRVFAAAGRPFSGALGEQAHAKADERFDLHLRRPRGYASSSSTFSTTRMTVLPSLRPSSAIRMKACPCSRCR